MTQFGFKAHLAAPYFTEAPPEISAAWASRSQKAGSKAYQGLKKAIKTRKDFKEKIAKPTQQAIASFISREFVSKSGHSHRNIMDKTRHSMKRAGKDYLERAKDGYQSGQNEETLESWQKEYSRQWCKYIGPLRGYKKGNIKGLAVLGVMVLCGDPKLGDFLKERIDVIEGTPCPALTGRGFRRILVNQLVHLGSGIIKMDYDASDIKDANEKLNQLVNQYRRPEIVPFAPDGDSHIKFIIIEIPDPAKPGQKVKCLGLDIQISMRE